MVIIETPVFTRRVLALLPDDAYRKLQSELAARPNAGAVIVGTGGLRKIRWGASGRGKRGGVRAIYYHAGTRAQILMLMIYAKNEADDLTVEQKRILRALVKEQFGEN